MPRKDKKWENCTPIGKPIEGTRFIAFKLPLSTEKNKKFEESIRLDFNILFRTIPNLGMVIDLTNTNRYYEPSVFEKRGIRHRKIMLRGGGFIPSMSNEKQFNDYVNNFLEKNAENDKLIGVHCRHGINRTGYLICRYMITELNIPGSKAIGLFADARGHCIQRRNYVQALEKTKLSQNNRDWKPDNRPSRKTHTFVKERSNFHTGSNEGNSLTWSTPRPPLPRIEVSTSSTQRLRYDGCSKQYRGGHNNGNRGGRNYNHNGYGYHFHNRYDNDRHLNCDNNTALDNNPYQNRSLPIRSNVDNSAQTRHQVSLNNWRNVHSSQTYEEGSWRRVGFN